MVEIYVVTHKQYSFPKYKIYKPIVAGAFEYDMGSFPGEYIRDDTHMNISNKHDLYSEYTVTYWIWKNSKADIVGLNHYRRYFIKGGWFSYFICLFDPAKKKDSYVLTDSYIEELFNKAGVECILPKKQWRVNRTLKEEFLGANSSNLLESTINVVKEFYPEYLPYFTKVLEAKENYQKCICIMNKKRFDEYCFWIFDIFSKLEDKGLTGKNREFAFLGERLLNVWVEYKKDVDNLRIKELFFINTEFSFKGIKKNHTELFFPKFFKGILVILTKLGYEMVVDRNKKRIVIQKRKGKI